MKNEFDYLNEAAVDLDEYEPAELTKEERLIMKEKVLEKSKKRPLAKRYIAVAAAAALAVAIAVPTFANNGFVEKIVKYVSLGHNIIIETDDSGAVFTLPEALNGRVFDKDGNRVTEIEGGLDAENIELYDENGVKYDAERWIELMCETGTVDNREVKVSTGSAYSGRLIPNEDKGVKVYTTAEEFEAFKDMLNFKPLEPEYLPEGYSFLYAEGFSDGDGNVSGDYAVIGYSNGENVFTIHERIINDETKFTASFDETVTETNIHGCAAAVSEHSADWEENGISVSILSGNSSVTGGELIKVAESVK